MGLPTNDYLRIISKSYGPRKPLVVCEASSLDMLADLDCAEGSTATVGGTEYVLDRVNGWVEPGSGGGGGSGVLVEIGVTVDEQTGDRTLQKTGQEILDYFAEGLIPYIDFSYTSDELSNHVTALFGAYATEPIPSGGIAHSFGFGSDNYFNCTALSDYPASSTL